jgi:hypothetical protein
LELLNCVPDFLTIIYHYYAESAFLNRFDIAVGVKGQGYICLLSRPMGDIRRKGKGGVTQT